MGRMSFDFDCLKKRCPAPSGLAPSGASYLQGPEAMLGHQATDGLNGPCLNLCYILRPGRLQVRRHRRTRKHRHLSPDEPTG